MAGGLTLGAVEPVLGQTTASGGFIKGNEELVLYGERSQHVTSVRMAHPPNGRPSPMRMENIFILRLRCRIRGYDHAILSPLRGDHPWVLHSGHRPPGTSSHDPRHGGPSVDLHHGGPEASSFRNASPFHRVCREPVETSI
ncbi:MAG: hypothetical protein Ct9H300mP25_11130 [Acidobacteriota bacterium]|nr:MAG: hypothetical protein Ct9H300mP25_11130 [Acidobacteriota bacterium]